MKKNRTAFLTGLLGLSVIILICTSTTAAIQTSQVPYDEDILWQDGNWMEYSVEFTNRIDPEDDEYFNTTVITADISYNITSGAATNTVTMMETISNITIEYANQSTIYAPFVALYDETVSMDDFLQDLLNETHAGANATSDYGIASHQTVNITLTNLTSQDIPDISNQFTYNKADNTITAISPNVTSRLLVSSNITGTVDPVNSSLKFNKLLEFGMIYSPLAFAGQNGSFWMDLGVNMSHITDLGLWSILGYSMEFHENETYSYKVGYEGDDSAFRWRTKFDIGYPKVGTNEKARYDSETGILLKYETEPTRWDRIVNETYITQVKPHKLEIELTGLSVLLQANATPKIPGYPMIIMLISLGIAFSIIGKRAIKKHSRE
ncbi:hypothetical protein GF325_10425 [Candidatus Bathyarchaeota archaeon]|nr:hypothetical protein [Candidatus Bathyarchaeota archaeon]